MKTAFITGSSRGIGRAIALRLASDGFKVILHGVVESNHIKNLKDEIKKNGGTTEIITADLCDLEATKILAEKVKDIDVLVLNASVQYRTPWQEITTDACYDQLNCNFISSMLLIQAAVPNMKKKGWGRIITIGSVQEAKPHPDMLVYSASKAALIGMTKALAKELGPSGITVNCIAPGVIDTDMNASLSESDLSDLCVETPLMKIGEPKDVAEAALFLASDKAGFITGAVLNVNGGFVV